MKKIISGLIILFAISGVVRGDLLGKIQNIDVLIQQGKYERAEVAARRLLTDPNITDQERASVQYLLNDIARKKSQKQQDNKEAQNEINRILATTGQSQNANNQNNGQTPVTNGENVDLTTAINNTTQNSETAQSTDTGTVPVGVNEDISDGSKYTTYESYEKAALSKKNADTINRLSQLYFKDGLYEKAVNLAKKDTTGDIRNLYVVAIGSRLTGKYDQSIDYYNRILAVSPGQAEARLGIGIAYKSKGEFGKALEYLKSYASSNSNSEVIKSIAELNEIVASGKK